VARQPTLNLLQQHLATLPLPLPLPKLQRKRHLKKRLDNLMQQQQLRLLHLLRRKQSEIEQTEPLLIKSGPKPRHDVLRPKLQERQLQR
jgi:hypothetical protein